MALFGLFKAKKPDPAVISAIKTHVFEALGHPEGMVIAVNEIDCNDPACPGVETVILIMATGKKTEACKIDKRMEDVTRADIATALGK